MSFSLLYVLSWLFFLLGVKQVSKGQFRRALDQAGLMAPALGAPASDLLTVKEVEVLSKRYAVKSNTRGGLGGDVGGEAEVNYWKLCEQIEKVYLPPEDTSLSGRAVFAWVRDACRCGGLHRSPGTHCKLVSDVPNLCAFLALVSWLPSLRLILVWPAVDRCAAGVHPPRAREESYLGRQAVPGGQTRIRVRGSPPGAIRGRSGSRGQAFGPRQVVCGHGRPHRQGDENAWQRILTGGVSRPPSK